MQITFDPHNEQDCATVARLLGTTTASEAPAPAPAIYVGSMTDIPDNDEQPAHRPDNDEQPAHRPDNDEQPAHRPDNDEPTADTADIHGMVWREDIHSSPPSMNADGSWRAKRGKKDEYEAAIKAHKAAAEHTAEQPVSTGMPGPSMPAAPAPTTPPAPIEYGAMAKRFVGKMNEGGLPEQYEVIYTALGVSFDDLQTNQTSIARLWHYMDAIDNGDTHDAAVRHAMGSV